MKALLNLMREERMDISFNGKTGKELGVFLYDFPVISLSNESYTSTSVAGKKGSAISKSGAIDNIIISCTFSIINKCFMPNIRELRKWLTGSGQLTISETSDCYYDVFIVEKKEFERELKSYGRFTVDFICFPYEFDFSGQQVAKVENGKLVNAFDESMPVYKINGQGVCTLTVNGKVMTANVNQNLIIDTRRMIAYTEDGISMNTSITGKYSDLYVTSGENNISITKGFELEVIPHWGWNA